MSRTPAKSRWPGRWDPVFDSMVQHKHSILFVDPANIKYLNRQGELSFKGSLLSQHSTLSLFYSTKHLMLFDYVLCAVFIPVLEDKCLPSGCKQWPMKYLRCCLYAQKQQCEKADCLALVKLSLKGGLGHKKGYFLSRSLNSSQKRLLNCWLLCL